MAGRRGQGGFGLFLLLVVLLGLFVTWLALREFNAGLQEDVVVAAAAGGVVPGAQRADRQALLAARDWLLGWALMPRYRYNSHPEESDPSAPPGLLPYPDRRGDGNYDGIADCPPSGSPLDHPAWALGRLPVAGDEVPDPTAATPVSNCRYYLTHYSLPGVRDAAGEPLWYAVSPNLLDDRAHAPRVNLNTLKQTNDRWLTVTNARGETLHDRVAFVLMAPGHALSGQRRQGQAPGPAAWLDAIDGLSNADDDLAFVSAARAEPGHRFNDRLLWLDRDRYLSHLARGVARRMAAWLGAQRDSDGQLAYPADDGWLQQPVVGTYQPPVPEWITRHWSAPDTQYMPPDPADPRRAWLQFPGCDGLVFELRRDGEQTRLEVLDAGSGQPARQGMC